MLTSGQVGIGTALPIIVSDLHGKEFEWVGSAYALSGTALLPLSGGLAQVSCWGLLQSVCLRVRPGIWTQTRNASYGVPLCRR